jgi:MtN3 and saliva related transmembrane protein
MDSTDFVGLLAAALTTAANVPQVLKTYRTKSGAGLSRRMLMTLSSGLGLWLVYGLLRKDLSIVVANMAGLSLTVSLLWLQWRYRNNAGAGCESVTDGARDAYGSG